VKIAAGLSLAGGGALASETDGRQKVDRGRAVAQLS
jgi:hypothetical protein